MYGNLPPLTLPPGTTMVPKNPLTGYSIGTILHGTNPKIGNLWIITLDHSFSASLLFEGKTKTVVNSDAYKRDKMRAGMQIALPNEIASILGGWAAIPTWAQSFILSSSITQLGASSGSSIKPSNPIAPGALPAVNAALAHMRPFGRKQLTDHGIVKENNESSCPARNGGVHIYEAYYGFTDVYEFCQFCDHKRSMKK